MPHGPAEVRQFLLLLGKPGEEGQFETTLPWPYPSPWGASEPKQVQSTLSAQGWYV